MQVALKYFIPICVCQINKGHLYIVSEKGCFEGCSE